MLGNMKFISTYFSTSTYHSLYIDRESRYLLVLTENYAALRLLQGKFHNRDPVVIFGSSFPKDQQYTQVYLSTFYLVYLLFHSILPTFTKLSLLLAGAPCAQASIVFGSLGGCQIVVDSHKIEY